VIENQIPRLDENAGFGVLAKPAHIHIYNTYGWYKLVERHFAFL
jgi:hypothetical protein